MTASLATLIEKNEDKLVDQAATSIKVMYSFAFADVAIEELRERLYNLLDNFVEIARRGALEPELVSEFAAQVVVGPLYAGFDNHSITEEVLQMVDMVINKMIDAKLNTPEQAEDKAQSKELLASVIREAKDIVNGKSRRKYIQQAAKRGELEIVEEPVTPAEPQLKS